MQKIGAVILAAGESSRLGYPKQIISFRGRSLIRRIVDAACTAGCSPVVVVIGSNEEKINRELEQASVVRVRNTSWRRGIGTSIRIGVEGLIDQAPDAEAIMLLVCDQPFVTANTIQSVIALREKTRKDIIASSYAHTLGVPALFDRSFFQELISLGDEAGAKSIILRNRARVAQFVFPGGRIDINSWNDYESLTNSA